MSNKNGSSVGKSPAFRGATLPASWLGWLALFGPGAVIASLTIGTGELIFSSRGGALFGYRILFLFLIIFILYEYFILVYFILFSSIFIFCFTFFPFLFWRTFRVIRLNIFITISSTSMCLSLFFLFLFFFSLVLTCIIIYICFFLWSSSFFLHNLSVLFLSFH